MTSSFQTYNQILLVHPETWQQEVETRPNKRKTFFPVVAPKPPLWESVPPTPGVLRMEAFVRRMEAEYDAEAAREAWRQSQKRAKVGSNSTNVVDMSPIPWPLLSKVCSAFAIWLGVSSLCGCQATESGAITTSKSLGLQKAATPHSSDELGAVDFADAADEVVDKASPFSSYIRPFSLALLQIHVVLECSPRGTAVACNHQRLVPFRCTMLGCISHELHSEQLKMFAGGRFESLQ